MKKVIAGALCLVMVLICATALAETAIDKAEVGTQVVIWVLCGVLSALGALSTWVAKGFIIPWLKDVAVP